MECFDKMLRGMGAAGIAALAEELLGALYPSPRRAAGAKSVPEAEKAKGGARAGIQKAEGEKVSGHQSAAGSGETGETTERADGADAEQREGSKSGTETEPEVPEGFKRKTYEPFLTFGADVRHRDFETAGNHGAESEGLWEKTDNFAHQGIDARSISEFFRRDSRRYDKEFERY